MEFKVKICNNYLTLYIDCDIIKLLNKKEKKTMEKENEKITNEEENKKGDCILKDLIKSFLMK